MWKRLILHFMMFAVNGLHLSTYVIHHVFLMMGGVKSWSEMEGSEWHQ